MRRTLIELMQIDVDAMKERQWREEISKAIQVKSKYVLEKSVSREPKGPKSKKTKEENKRLKKKSKRHENSVSPEETSDDINVEEEIRNDFSPRDIPHCHRNRREQSYKDWYAAVADRRIMTKQENSILRRRDRQAQDSKDSLISD